MTKIGRNASCPCGSGKKYKRCCINDIKQSSPQQQISITSEVEKLQEMATARQTTFNNIGVFILFSTAEGDGWLLELTDKDALKVAENGKKIAIEIDESSETIEVNWSHQFTATNSMFTTIAYSDKHKEVHTDYPSSAIYVTQQRIIRQFSTELLESIHVD